MKASYVRVMDALQRICMIISGFCLVVITIIIPWGVFTRYVLNSASSWPEPMAVLLMIWFSFLSAALCYRENLHIGVKIIPALVSGQARVVTGWLIEACMMGTNLFMLVYGTLLVQATWHQVIAEFPIVLVGISYLPVPLGGGITMLFVVERLWLGGTFGEPSDIAHVSTE